MKNYKIRITAFFACLLLGTSACGAREQTDDASRASVKAYGIERELTLSLSEQALSGCFVTDQNIYYEDKEKGVSCLIMQELAAQTKPVQLFTLKANEVMHAFTVTEAGEIIMAVKCFGITDDNDIDWDSGAAMELRKTNEKGELLWKQEIPDVQQDAFITQILSGSDGRIYVSAQKELFFFDEAGKPDRRLTVKGQMIQQLADVGGGKLAVRQSTQNGQNITVYQGADGKELFQKDFREDRIWFKDREGLYYLDNDMLAVYDWESGSGQAMLSFTDCGMEASIMTIRIFRALGKERYLIGLKEDESAVIRFVWLNSQANQAREESEEEEVPKTQLTFAAFASQDFQGSVARFNQSHKNYEVILKGFKYPEQEAQFYACLVSKDSPDILEISGRTEKYVSNGYLLDLTPFIEKSDRINWDDYISRMPEDIAVNGRIYALPKRVSLTVLACPTSLLKGKDSWDIGEYLDLLEEYPDALSWEGASVERIKEEILRCALYNGINGFVDREAGTAALDGGDFRSILERIAALDVKTVDKSTKTRVREGDIVLWELYMNSAVELQEAEGISGREMTLIGYPVSGKVQGERSSNHISYGHEVGIHSDTENAEAAWEYVETYFIGAQEKNSFFFTPGKDAFEEKLQEGLGEEFLSLDGGNVVVCPELTEVQVEKVRNAVLRATVFGDEAFEIIGIIAEEAAPYFTGDKSLDNVVEIIQSCVQLYLDERG
ncbi:MAG: hypothetical protein K2O06_05380 [Acetatifactor sp.]|nr:hypothetical protein [Acetatifactor sp.]